MLHYIVCADVGALYFMRLDIWLFKITDDHERLLHAECKRRAQAQMETF